MQVTFFDDKIDPVTDHNWIVAAISELHGHLPIGLICEPRQGIHTVVGEKFPDVRIFQFDRDRFYAQDGEQLRRMGRVVAARPQLIWHVSHFEGGTTPTETLHRLVRDVAGSELLIKTGTVREEFTPDNYFPEGGAKIRCIYAVSEHTKRLVVQQCGAPESKVVVNYMGVDLSLFDARAPDLAAARASYDLRPEDKVIGVVGSLVERKRPLEILEVFGAVARSDPDVVLVYVGRGPLEVAIEQRARQLGLADRVRLLGYQQNVTDLMEALDILVLFSRLEGAIPRVILEAMAMRTAVVAADLGGIREVIQDGANGVMIASGDSAALEAALRVLTTDEDRRAEIVDAALRSVRRFDRAGQLGELRRHLVSLAAQ